MNSTERNKFRNTKIWKDFREEMKERIPYDCITGRKLYKGWTLHHCNLRPEDYHILNPEHFNPLNKQTHELVHFLYNTTRYQDIETTLRNIYYLITKMLEINKGGK